MKLLTWLGLSLLLFSQTAWGCDSFDDCMMDCKNMVEGATYGKTVNGKVVTEIKTKETACFQGIAYKLEEIAQKLDHKEAEYVPVGPILLKKEKSK